MKIIVLERDINFVVERHYSILGLSIQPENLADVENIDAFFSLELNNFDLIINNIPMCLAVREFTFTPYPEPMVFKFIRPLLLKPNDLIKYRAKYPSSLCLYSIMPSKIASDDLKPTRLRCDVINETELFHLFTFEKHSKIISIGFTSGIKERREPRDTYILVNKFVKHFGLIYDNFYPPAFFEDDVKIRLTMTQTGYEFWDDKYRPLFKLIGSIQAGQRFILKDITTGTPQKEKKILNHLQISLEKSIFDVNTERKNNLKDFTYLPLHVIVEYCHIE